MICWRDWYIYIYTCTERVRRGDIWQRTGDFTRQVKIVCIWAPLGVFLDTEREISTLKFWQKVLYVVFLSARKLCTYVWPHKQNSACVKLNGNCMLSMCANRMFPRQTKLPGNDALRHVHACMCKYICRCTFEDVYITWSISTTTVEFL